jgi:hypothetical protein
MQNKNNKSRRDNFEEEQISLCDQYNAIHTPVSDDQLVVISEGVYEGDPLEGVRYPSPKHMSGWWLTTDKYNGNPDTLKTEHIYHLVEKRPEVMKYLSLPYGFRFRTGGNIEDVWFDEKVAKEKA